MINTLTGILTGTSADMAGITGTLTDIAGKLAGKVGMACTLTGMAGRLAGMSNIWLI